MWGRLKYGLSHAAAYVCRTPRLPGSDCGSSCDSKRSLGSMILELRKSRLGVQYVGYLSHVVLIAALCLGLYIRWAHSQDIAVLLIAFLGLFVFAITGALIYYFSLQAVGSSVARLWLGCLLGVVSFPEADIYSSDLLQKVHDAMNILLATSLVIKGLWTLVERVFQLVRPGPRLVDPQDILELVGVAISSLVLGKDFLAISLLVLALALTVTGIRMRSFLALGVLLVLVVLTSAVFFPRLLQVPANPFSLSLVLGRVALEPVADLYFSGLTTLQRWEPLLQRSRPKQRLLVLLVTIAEVCLFVYTAQNIPTHKEWFVVVPLFTAFGLVWVSYHLVFLVTLWQLTTKISECNLTYRGLEEGARNMLRIMSSKGVRHFSLISQRLALVTMVTTLLLAALSWQTKTAVSLSLWLVVLPLESAIISLLWEMGSTLGGTCVGYGLVAPAIYRKEGVGSSPCILPAGSVETLANSATSLLNTVQKFFSYHLIDTFGCDFSSSGLTLDSVGAKLRSFFQQTSSAGPRYDTYLLYYSGPVHEDGNWALAGQEKLTFDQLMEWWHQTDCYSGARLILVLDTQYSFRWNRQVRRLHDYTLGVQTCMLTPPRDAEEPVVAHIGDFTADWVDYNCGNMGDVKLHSKDRQLRAAYAVSRSWSDFTFHLPTDQDNNQHWVANFPRFTKPLIRITNFPKVGSIFCCCGCVLQCLKRQRMLWLPPIECDTRHGFKLIRS